MCHLAPLLCVCLIAATSGTLLAGTKTVPSITPAGQTTNGVLLGNIVNTSLVNKLGNSYSIVDYAIDLTKAANPTTSDNSGSSYTVYVPSTYDGSKPYGLLIYGVTSNVTNGTGYWSVLTKLCDNENLILLSPEDAGNSLFYDDYRAGAGILAAYRAQELYNIDPRGFMSGVSPAADAKWPGWAG